MSFRVVQPWGRDKVQQSTMLSEHRTAAAAFAEIDRLSSEMVRTGAPASMPLNSSSSTSNAPRSSADRAHTEIGFGIARATCRHEPL